MPRVETTTHTRAYLNQGEKGRNDYCFAGGGGYGGARWSEESLAVYVHGESRWGEEENERRDETTPKKSFSPS